MIIKLGFVRDGHIVGTKFYSSHEVVMIPIMSPTQFAKLEAAMKTGGPSNLVVFSPPTMQKSVDELTKWIPEGISDFTNGLPPKFNPLGQGQRTPGGILVPGEFNLRVTGPSKSPTDT